MDKKIAMVLILFLIVGVVAVSGCTSSDNTTTPANTTMSNASTTTENTAAPATTEQNSAVATSTATPSTTASSASATYVGNSNTHKFHLATCRYVSKMSEDHKVYFNTRQDAINAGYVPCKVCNP